MTWMTQEQRNASYRRGWTDSLRAYFAMYENQGPSPYDYGQGWHDCARERWRDPDGRGVIPDGVPVPQSQSAYRAWASARERSEHLSPPSTEEDGPGKPSSLPLDREPLT